MGCGAQYSWSGIRSLEHGQHEPPDDEYRTCGPATIRPGCAHSNRPLAQSWQLSWPPFVDFVNPKHFRSTFDRSSSVSYNNNSIPIPSFLFLRLALIDHDLQHSNTLNTYCSRDERQTQAGRARRWRIVCEKGKARSGRQGAARALQVGPLPLLRVRYLQLRRSTGNEAKDRLAFMHMLENLKVR